MYAIVNIAGQQFKVKKNQKLYVNRLNTAEGSQVEFEKVLLMDRDGKVSVGKPLIDGARVAAKVLAHVKDDKILVFKKKRRKGYKKMQGHRQYLSEILIQGILEKGETLKIEEAEPKKTRAKKVTAKAEAEPAEEKAPEVKKTRTRKAAAPAEKKETKKVSRKKKD